ncbi:MAG: cation transporter [Erysipelotrichaceae bacterium]|nr:cation transporter [Erysipelotrichaceae bacterium]
MKKELLIEGMSCHHCVKRVAQALQAIDGVQATVNLEQKKAVVELAHDVSDEVLIAAVDEAGYKVEKIN